MREFKKIIDGSVRVILAALVIAAILYFVLQPEYLLILRSHPHSVFLPTLMFAAAIVLYILMLWHSRHGGRWIPIHLDNQFKACFLTHYDSVTVENPHEETPYTGRFIDFASPDASKPKKVAGMRERDLFNLNIFKKILYWFTGNKIALIDLGANVYAKVPSYCIKKID